MNAERLDLPGPVVDATWLKQNLGRVAVADVRWSVADGPGRKAYADGHLPGAVFVDLDRDLSDPPGSRGRHPLPPIDTFRATVDRLGLSGRPVVCYDDVSGAMAARLWWMLQAIGRPVAVLDGGLQAWPGPWESGPAVEPDRIETERPPRLEPGDSGDEWPVERIIAIDDIGPELDRGVTGLDARTADRFSGRPNPIDSPAGHIPGTRSRPWSTNVDLSGRFLTADQLADSLRQSGLDSTSPWFASCGSGVTACHNILAAAVAGLAPGRLYVGSWSEWSQDPARPIATGDDQPD